MPPDLFYNDYIATYLQRDVRTLIDVSSLRDFDLFINACALRAGQLVNFSEIAKDTAVSSTTIKKWISILETSGIVALVKPYYTNFRKRLVKKPKLFFLDHGLLCHLLGVSSIDAFLSHPLKGQLWENFVYGELVKKLEIAGKSSELYFWRDSQGTEVDFVYLNGPQVSLMEAKLAQQPRLPVKPLEKVAELFESQGYAVSKIVACRSEGLPVGGYQLWNPLSNEDVPYS